MFNQLFNYFKLFMLAIAKVYNKDQLHCEIVYFG
jgi:hypothetical protein